MVSFQHDYCVLPPCIRLWTSRRSLNHMESIVYDSFLAQLTILSPIPPRLHFSQAIQS